MSSPIPPGADRESFQPGTVFAGRYRIVTRIGRGGMGEVWRADDLMLGTPVALKLIHQNSPDTRERIIGEARLARQITHPAVCRVFDVGEAQGEIFLSMELVQGEDLATLVRRVGRLPSEKVIDIGRQLCAGLGAAHAQGVLHRDLKPANVLVDQDGSIRIADFGIAVGANERRRDIIAGTPDYMAPEQLVADAALSARTDLYALGLVLFELVTGRRPSRARPDVSARLPKPSALVHDVDPQLDRAIMQATEPDPRNRPVSAAAVADMLRPVAPAAKRTRTAPWLAGAALIGVAAVAAALSSLFLTRGRVALTSQDTIVLADFDNTTGEPVFDRALKVALAVALEQSPFLKVFPDDRVRETLRLMQRAPDEPVVRSLARDVARRERLKALVSGSIGKLGANYVIALEAINAETGDVMALEQVEAPAQEEVLTALGAASARLRENLGESLASIEKFGVPLPQATTASLEALHAYALALDQGRVIPRVEAIPHLQRAIELDPDFALALALLSGVYANTGRSAEAPVLSRRAFELRDRVSERERFFISWRYYLDAAQAWENALDLAEAWTTTYPREAFAFNALGLASAAFGQHGQAVEAFREAIRLDDRFVPPYGNMTGSLMSLNRFEEARASLQEAAKHGISFITIERMTFLLAFIENRQAEMARELDRVRSSADALWASAWEARTAAFSGQFRTAHARYRAGVQAALRDRVPELAAQWTMEDAEAHAIAGECAETRREVPEGLALGRDNFTLERASRALALCGDGGAMSPLTAELVKRFPDATLTMRIQLPVANAALALAHGDAARALERLDPVAPYDNAPAAEFWPAYLRGQAHFLAKEGKEAAAQFQAIVDRRGQAPTSPLYPLAHLGLARALALAGSPDAARAAYERFFTLWAGVEAGVRPAAEARREYARLK